MKSSDNLGNVPIDVAILTIATNHYIEYWKELVRSSEKTKNEKINLRFHVFTEQKQEALNFARNSNSSITIHEIPSYRWPEATLLRYQVISTFGIEFTEPILMHLDADMLFMNKIPEAVFTQVMNGGIALVRHPGFFRPRGIGRFEYYFASKRRILGDLFSTVRIGGLGSWETNPKSAAYVKFWDRRKYFCGGTWFGRKEDILGMASTLAGRVETDLASSRIAIWHDESHLNWWAVHNKYIELSPSFCFDPTYPQLSKLPEFIRAVDKSQS
jgi:Glycosyltransferase family 6